MKRILKYISLSLSLIYGQFDLYPVSDFFGGGIGYSPMYISLKEIPGSEALTNVGLDPSKFKDPLDLKSSLTDIEYKVYELIWKRTVASQMNSAKTEQTKLEITSDLSHQDKIFNLKFNSNILGFDSEIVFQGKKSYMSSNLLNLNTNDNIDLVIKNLNIKLGKLFLDCDQNKYFYYNKSKYEVKINFNQEIDSLS